MKALGSAPKQLSKFKWKRLAIESLRNSLRLIQDSRLLFEAKSYPSSYQLAVLSLEELSKACWLERYYYSSITNTGFASEDFEQDFLKLLYLHGKKQFAFIAPNEFEYPIALVQLLKTGGLERRKQEAVYVGLSRDKKSVQVESRISVPRRTISEREAKKLVAWVISEFIFMMDRLYENESYFGITAMDEVLKTDDATSLRNWPYKSHTRSLRHRVAHLELLKNDF